MDDIEITVFNEINDYKEKIYFFNIRQWLFAILIVIIVVPTYLLLKDRIGEDITSYIVIAIAGVLGFVGFVKIHELPAEKILPFWFRHYFLFAKPIHYISDKDFELQHQKRNKKQKSISNNSKLTKSEIKAIKKQQKQEKLLQKARKKYGYKQEEIKSEKTIKNEKNEHKKEDELAKKLSNLTEEEQDVLFKLLGR